MMRKFANGLSCVLLFAAACIAMGAAASVYLLDAPLPEGIVLWILGLIALALGITLALRIERLANYDESTKTINEAVKKIDRLTDTSDRLTEKSLNIESSVGSILGTLAEQRAATFSLEQKEVFQSTEPVVANAKHSINALASSYLAPAPDWWIERIAIRLKHLQDANQAIRHNIKTLIDFNDIPIDFVSQHEERMKIYDRHGVAESVSWEFLDCKNESGFDVLIVDERFVSIRFPLLPKSAKKGASQSGINFNENTELGAAFAHWYSNLPHGISFAELKKLVMERDAGQIGQKQPSKGLVREILKDFGLK